MALGGGTFTTQNKILPGTYMNFVSAASASATLSDRGIATMPLVLNWGPVGEVFTVTAEDFQKNSLKIFGYPYDADELKGLRDLFKNIHTLYAYRVNGGQPAVNSVGVMAKHPGTAGNNIKIIVSENIDDNTLLQVDTYYGTTPVDTRLISPTTSGTYYPEDNDWVTWGEGITLSPMAITLMGGNDAVATAADYQSYIDKIESYSFNAMGVPVSNSSISQLFVSFCKRMRDEMGVKFQLVVYNTAADYYGVINVKNKTTDSGWEETGLIYWVTGIIAGCAVNKSNQNKLYDGEFSVDTNYTQAELETAISSGEFMLHRVGNDVRVLADINSMVTTSDTEGDVFKENQTIRVTDQIANDIAVLFNTKYLGAVPNDNAGRLSLWADIVKLHKELNDLRAIENFADSDITVEQGDTKKSVVVNGSITPINAMGQLYMTVTVE